MGVRLAHSEQRVLSGGKPERPLVVDAAELMNSQATLDDVRIFLARQARLQRAFAAESERIAGAISTVLVRLAGSIAATERAK